MDKIKYKLLNKIQIKIQGLKQGKMLAGMFKVIKLILKIIIYLIEAIDWFNSKVLSKETVHFKMDRNKLWNKKSALIQI